MPELQAVRAELAAHYALRPQLPRPYDPNSDAAKHHQAELQAWVNKEQRLLSKIQGLEFPMVFERQDPMSKVQRALPGPAKRFRK